MRDPSSICFWRHFFPCDDCFSPHQIILLFVSSWCLFKAFCPSIYFPPASWLVTESERWLNPGCLSCEILGLTYSALAGSLGSVVEDDTLLLPMDLNSPSLQLLSTLGWILEFRLPLGWVSGCWSAGSQCAGWWSLDFHYARWWSPDSTLPALTHGRTGGI